MNAVVRLMVLTFFGWYMMVEEGGMVEAIPAQIGHGIHQLNCASKECPPPYTLVLDECFFLNKKALKWAHAREHCQGMKGDLATPEHLYALKSYVVSQGTSSVWVGASDERHEGTWRWVTRNNLVNYDLFYPGQPNGARSHNCGYLSPAHHPPLYSYPCTHALVSVCQYLP